MFNKFDKIVVKVENDNYKIRKAYFNTISSPDTNVILYHSHSDKGRGLKIVIRYINNHVEFEFSSKILGKRCIELITIFNITDIWKVLYQYIDIPIEKFLFGEVRYCEVVSEIKQEQYWRYIEALHECSRLQTRFRATKRPYKRYGKSSSFWLKKDQLTKTNPEYLSIYNKYNELTDTSKIENVEFLALLEEEDRNNVLEYYRDRIRIENKCQNKTNIKNQFQINDCRLLMILTSSKNITLRKMEDIYSEIINNKAEIEDLKYNEYIKLKAFESHDYDFDKFYQELKLRGCTREKCKVLKEYRDLYSKSFRLLKSDTIELINEIIKKIQWSIKNS